MQRQSVEQKVCPYCQGGNAPNAAQCQWCGRWLPTSNRRTWGWLLIFAGIACLLLLGVAFLYMLSLSVAGSGMPMDGITMLIFGAFAAVIAVLFFLPGALLLRRKSG